MRIAMFASGEGTTLAAILEAIDAGFLAARVALVVSNNADSGALTKAKNAGVQWLHLSRMTHPDPADLDHGIREALDVNQIDVVVLAGYLRKIGPETLSHYASRIINTHPSLLPKHGGQGMYGRRVHEAVLQSGDTESGVSVHLVDGEYDAGRVIAQTKILVDPEETLETLDMKVRALERRFLCEVLQDIALGKIALGHPSYRS
jgi:phosphoribosylglycinamide formyltransferase 1